MSRCFVGVETPRVFRALPIDPLPVRDGGVMPRVKRDYEFLPSQRESRDDREARAQNTKLELELVEWKFYY